MFHKIIKNNSYYSRYQVKFRRRRNGKTDYYARKRLTVQDKTKYNSPRYRLVVRFSNKDVICQLIYAQIQGDQVVCAAYSHELPRYGVKVGLTNYAAAYATGLLLARRHLSSIGLADNFEGNDDVGSDFTATPVNGRRPFKALLDVGLARTSTGARVFAAMKGACDGGLNVPHSAKRLIGSEGNRVNSDVLRSYILGGHVANWMNELQEKGDGSYERAFSKYIREGIKADDIEQMWIDCHAAIRADPSHKSTKKELPKGFVQKRFNRKKLNHAARKNRINQILAHRASSSTD
eukprot:CAMPEP_0201549606 /NCGR_PEP_ID=MMETSP0173_2-20130828/6052_1 /ASSEMBLY_ACC=CAM_ASM_000268 /TAXON_ID=218659 /ORGANISM="Vexillifera sp., Strain DIVA3 564/2" /LENGTH=291 /DNA_ID=CAMNT_0047959323 /DNA_START=59 /DNA_END=934 /DNA_ORIENTATION=-